MNFYQPIKTSLYLGFLIFNRLRIIGAENIPKTGAAILAGNHVSNWDPPLMGGASKRQVFFLAKEELFKFPLGFVLRNLGVIPLKRGRSDREAISKSIEILKAGDLLGVFVEGTRNHSEDGKMGKVQPGAAMMAHKTGVPVIPVHILNSRNIGKGFPKVTVIFGKQIEFKCSPDLDKKDLYSEMSKEIVEAIESLTLD